MNTSLLKLSINERSLLFKLVLHSLLDYLPDALFPSIKPVEINSGALELVGNEFRNQAKKVDVKYMPLVTEIFVKKKFSWAQPG